MTQADYVTLHCPQNNETMGLINRQRLERMKKGSFLINLARGGVVESLDPIYEMLINGHLRGAALDVFLIEPPDHTHPIFSLQNCLVSPHAMATTEGAMTRIYESMANDMAAILDGAEPEFVVNPETLLPRTINKNQFR
jgi:phosphoglycerate dehydrogenase-like enzyme